MLKKMSLKKAVSVILVLVIMLACIGSLAENQNDTSEGPKWGMSIAQVKTTQRNVDWDLIVGEDGITCWFYSDSTISIRNVHAFVFVSGYFRREILKYTDEYDDYDMYTWSYNNFKGESIKAFGDPDSDDTIWSNEEYKGNPKDYSKAVLAGDLICKTVWKKPDANISMVWSGGDGQCTITFYFDDPEYPVDFEL